MGERFLGMETVRRCVRLRSRTRVLLVAISVIGCSIGVRVENAATDGPGLAVLLAQMARVATLYRGMALKFECTETIEYRAHQDWRPPSGYEKFSYLYERDAKGRLKDCRLGRTHSGKGENVRCVEPYEYQVPLYLSNAYLWIFAFLEERQPWHEYRIVGEEIVLGRPSIVVDYGPKDEVREDINDWYGRAWIDRESSQLLRVQAYRPKHWAAKQHLDEDRATIVGDHRAPEYEIEWVITEFNEEKNGMRFVSEVQLHRARYDWVSDYKEKKLLDVRQTYERYRFYRVATGDEIKGIVEGKTPTASPP